MWLPFKKKGAEGGEPVESRVPVNRVTTLSSQGLSEPEIIKTLKEEGYSPSEVDKAMKEALKDTVRSQPSRELPPREPRELPPREEFGLREPTPTREPPLELEDMEESGIPRLPEIPGERRPRPGMEELDDDFEEEKPAFRGLPPELGSEEELPPIPELERPARGRRREDRRSLEELAEGIAEEKWNEFRSELLDVHRRMQQVDNKITSIEKSIDQIRGERKGEVDEIKASIDEYKQSITEIGERMESMEKALRDSLSPMMESLRSLSDTIKTLKGGKGKG